MASSHFLSVSDLSSLTFVEAEGRPVVQQYDRLVSRLEQAEGDLAAFFAEPAMASKQSAAPQISWYSRHEGPVVAFPDLPPAERAAASEALVDQLDRLRPLLSDPAFGPFLGHCLVVPRHEDVVLVGGKPVLRNWGFVGANASTDDASLARIFEAILGRFAGYPQPPWKLVPPSVPIEGATVAATAVPLPGGAPAVSGVPAAEAVPPLPPSPPGPPWWRRPAMVAAIMAVLLLVVGIASYLVMAASQPALTEAERAEQAVLDANRPILDQRVAAFKTASTSDPCSAASADTAVVDEQIIQHHLTDSVGWVLVRDGKPIARGAAFFITPELLVTRHSAIAGADPHAIVVVFPMLAGTFPAEVVAQTSAADEKSGSDFAVLKVMRPQSAIDVLALSPAVGLGTPVYAASYPTFFSPRYTKEMYEGNTTTAPALVMTGGVVDKIDGPAIHHSASLWKGSAGAPLMDACGRVIGVNNGTVSPGGPTAATAAKLIEFLKNAKIPFTENDLDCLAKPVLATPVVAAAKP